MIGSRTLAEKFLQGASRRGGNQAHAPAVAERDHAAAQNLPCFAHPFHLLMQVRYRLGVAPCLRQVRAYQVEHQGLLVGERLSAAMEGAADHDPSSHLNSFAEHVLGAEFPVELAMECAPVEFPLRIKV